MRKRLVPQRALHPGEAGGKGCEIEIRARSF
jgi:hypothetical protein